MIMRAVTYPGRLLPSLFGPEIHFGAAAQRHFTPGGVFLFFFILYHRPPKGISF